MELIITAMALFLVAALIMTFVFGMVTLVEVLLELKGMPKKWRIMAKKHVNSFFWIEKRWAFFFWRKIKQVYHHRTGSDYITKVFPTVSEANEYIDVLIKEEAEAKKLGEIRSGKNIVISTRN